MGAGDKTGKTLQRLNAGKGQTGGKAGEAERRRVRCVQSWGSPRYKVLRKKRAGGARVLAVVQVEAFSGSGQGVPGCWRSCRWRRPRAGTSWDVSWCRDGVVGKYAIHGATADARGRAEVSPPHHARMLHSTTFPPQRSPGRDTASWECWSSVFSAFTPDK